VLYRKRTARRFRLASTSGIRFRYSRQKEAARGCGGRGVLWEFNRFLPEKPCQTGTKELREPRRGCFSHLISPHVQVVLSGCRLCLPVQQECPDSRAYRVARVCSNRGGRSMTTITATCAMCWNHKLAPQSQKKEEISQATRSSTKSSAEAPAAGERRGGLNDRSNPHA
jgi:hypothetical protein